jgi:nucleoid-associated protein YgaU
MYATPVWRFSVARPPHRLRIGLRKAVLGAGAAVVIVFALAQSAWGAGPSGPTRYRVEAGDTLWTIAAAHYPGQDVRDEVLAIERANHLESPFIYPGEELALPGS